MKNLFVSLFLALALIPVMGRGSSAQTNVKFDYTKFTSTGKMLTLPTYKDPFIEAVKAHNDEVAKEAAEKARVAAQIVPDTQSAPEPVKIAPTPVKTAYSNDYDWGNCTWYVASHKNVPDNLGNANTWAYMARLDGFSVSPNPKVGAVAQTSAGYFGHVAIVEAVGDSQVEVSEMNVQGLGVVDDAWYSTSNFNYIYFDG